MNDKTEQALTDALIDQIESAARASFRRHQGRIKGQLLTAADCYDFHLLHAAYQAGIHAMHAQLVEAQKDEERLDWLEDNWHRPVLEDWEDRFETLRAAIDAAKGRA